MIIPGETNFKGVIGTTFDAVTTIYIIENTLLVWQSPLLWESTKTYQINNAVVASNGEAYKCIKTNFGFNPTSSAEYWELITPLNITSYTAKMKIGTSLTLEGGKGLTLGGSKGTVAIEMTPTQTEIMSSSTHYSLVMTNTSSKVYEYLKGSIEWLAE
jgi:hypothetical protein